MEYKVIVSWDAEKGVWFTVESEIAGLWAEAPSLPELVEVIRDVAPELVAHNHPNGHEAGVRILEDRGRLVSFEVAA